MNSPGFQTFPNIEVWSLQKIFGDFVIVMKPGSPNLSDLHISYQPWNSNVVFLSQKLHSAMPMWDTQQGAVERKSHKGNCWCRSWHIVGWKKKNKWMMWRLVSYLITPKILVHVAIWTKPFTSSCSGKQEPGRYHLFPGKQLYKRY